MRDLKLSIALALVGCSAAPPTAQPPPVQAASPKAAVALRLEVGEVAQASAGRAPLLTEPGERYLAVVTSAALGDGVHGYRVATHAGTAGAASTVSTCSLDATDAVARAPRVPTADRPVDVGAKRTIQFRRDGVATPVDVEAVAVGRYATVWADRSPDHPAALDAAFATDFLEDFEAIILPRARAVFGGESDVDADGRIALFFTPLTRERAVAFFSGCDLHPQCPASNAGEVLYLTPPNAIRPPYNTPRAIKEILAHELGHLLHHHHKVLAHRVDADRDSLYLHEGLGALAQDVTGFQAGNLYVTKAGLAQLNDTTLNAVLAEGTGYHRDHDGPLRGLSYLFVRWLYDRAGGDVVADDGAVVDRGGPSRIRFLLGSPRSVAAEVLDGVERDALVADFFTTLAASEAKASNPCFSFRPTVTDPVTSKQRGADPHARFHGQSMGGAATQGLPGDGRLRAGGGELVRLTSEGGPVTVALEVDAAAEATLRVVRVE
jgi:hypothetical protein